MAMGKVFSSLILACLRYFRRPKPGCQPLHRHKFDAIAPFVHEMRRGHLPPNNLGRMVQNDNLKPIFEVADKAVKHSECLPDVLGPMCFYAFWSSTAGAQIQRQALPFAIWACEPEIREIPLIFYSAARV